MPTSSGMLATEYVQDEHVASDQKHLLMGPPLQVLMKRNSTYIAFVLAGALLGERVRLGLACVGISLCCPDLTPGSSHMCSYLQVVNSAFDSAWEKNNQGVNLSNSNALHVVAVPHSSDCLQLQKLFKHIEPKLGSQGGDEEGGDE